MGQRRGPAVRCWGRLRPSTAHRSGPVVPQSVRRAGRAFLLRQSVKSAVMSSGPFPPAFSIPYQESLVYVAPVRFHSKKFCLQISFFLGMYIYV